MKMKYEWRKQEKTTYATKKQPQLLMGSSMRISSMRKHRRVNLMITLFFRLKGSGH